MSAAARALEAILELLEDAGVDATRDAGTFAPAPIGVLIGLPSWTDTTLGGRVYEIPVLVVSADPLNTTEAVDALYATADAIADALGASGYRPATWGSESRPQPLPAIEIVATATASLTE